MPRPAGVGQFKLSKWANSQYRNHAFRLAQRAQDLLFAVALLRHSRALLRLLQRTTAQAPFSTYRRYTFRVLGQRSFCSRLKHTRQGDTLWVAGGAQEVAAPFERRSDWTRCFFRRIFFNAVNRRARDDLDRAAALFERPTEIRSNDVASLIVLLATVCELTTQRSD